MIVEKNIFHLLIACALVILSNEGNSCWAMNVVAAPGSPTSATISQSGAYSSHSGSWSFSGGGGRRRSPDSSSGRSSPKSQQHSSPAVSSSLSRQSSMENDRERGGSPVLLPSSLSAALGWAHSRSWSSSGNSNRLQQRVHASLNGNGNRRAHLTEVRIKLSPEEAHHFINGQLFRGVPEKAKHSDLMHVIIGNTEEVTDLKGMDCVWATDESLRFERCTLQMVLEQFQIMSRLHDQHRMTPAALRALLVLAMGQAVAGALDDHVRSKIDSSLGTDVLDLDARLNAQALMLKVRQALLISASIYIPEFFEEIDLFTMADLMRMGVRVKAQIVEPEEGGSQTRCKSGGSGGPNGCEKEAQLPKESFSDEDRKHKCGRSPVHMEAAKERELSPAIDDA